MYTEREDNRCVSFSSTPAELLRHIDSFLDYQYTYFLYFIVEWYDARNRMYTEKMTLSLDEEIERNPDMLYTDIHYARHMFEIGYGTPDQPWTYGVKYNPSLWSGTIGSISPFQFVNTIWLGKRDNRNSGTFERIILCTDEYVEHEDQIVGVSNSDHVEFKLVPGKIAPVEYIQHFIQKDLVTRNWINRL